MTRWKEYWPTLYQLEKELAVRVRCPNGVLAWLYFDEVYLPAKHPR